MKFLKFCLILVAVLFGNFTVLAIPESTTSSSNINDTEEASSNSTAIPDSNSTTSSSNQNSANGTESIKEALSNSTAILESNSTTSTSSSNADSVKGTSTESTIEASSNSTAIPESKSTTSSPTPNFVNGTESSHETSSNSTTIPESTSTTSSSKPNSVNGSTNEASSTSTTAPTIQILKDIRSAPKKSGEYSYEIHVSDGTVLKQSAKLSENLDNDPEADQSLIVSGEYEFIDPAGMKHRVAYIADKRGFRPIIGGVGSISDSNPSSKNATKNANLTEPLDTISSSLFSSPEA